MSKSFRHDPDAPTRSPFAGRRAALECRNTDKGRRFEERRAQRLAGFKANAFSHWETRDVS